MTESREDKARDLHTPSSLADVLEQHYFPMHGGAKLFLSEGEWRMVIAALRASPYLLPRQLTGARSWIGWKTI